MTKMREESNSSTAKRIRRKSAGNFFRTPYSAIKKRKINFERPSSAPRRRRTVAPTNYFKDFPKQFWRTHYATPLYNFQNDNNSLKRYTQYLTCHILSEKHKNIAFNPEENESTQIKVDISIEKYSREGESCVEFTVKDIYQKLLCRVVLCCFDFKHDKQFLQQSLSSYVVPTAEHKKIFDKNFTVLPLVLTKGLITYQNIVLKWIRTNFDCKISPLKFNVIELSWMVAMWTKVAPESQARSTKFTWKTVQDNNLKKMSASVQPSSVSNIWQNCCPNDNTNSQLLADQKDKFISMIEQQFSNILGIKITSLPLIEIDTPFADVKREGQVKIWSQDHCYTVLSHLTCLCTERLGVAV